MGVRTFPASSSPASVSHNGGGRGLDEENPGMVGAEDEVGGKDWGRRLRRQASAIIAGDWERRRV